MDQSGLSEAILAEIVKFVHPACGYPLMGMASLLPEMTCFQAGICAERNSPST
jgi:hypothetical protein